MYEWRSHTSELELFVQAETEKQVLQDAMKALAELLGSAEGESRCKKIELEAPDRGALLVGWIEELLFLAETEQLVPEEAEIELGSTKLRATVRGRAGEPSPLVKAATYHGLEFARRGFWQARVVLDV